MINRKLIRPNLADLKDRQGGIRSPSMPLQGVRDVQGGGMPPQSSSQQVPQRRRQAPPETTSAEAFYYLKQMNNKTPMVLLLDDGEELRGHIEWYDRACIKVNRDDAPNLLVYKHSIKYMYKQEEETGAGPRDDPYEEEDDQV